MWRALDCAVARSPCIGKSHAARPSAIAKPVIAKDLSIGFLPFLVIAFPLEKFRERHQQNDNYRRFALLAESLCELAHRRVLILCVSMKKLIWASVIIVPVAIITNRNGRHS